MKSLYRKELLLTVLFTFILILAAHSASIFVAFPALQRGTFWGFPVHYIVPILLGWFGVTVVCYVMAIYCNRLDDEIDDFASQYNEKTTSKEEK